MDPIAKVRAKKLAKKVAWIGLGVLGAVVGVLALVVGGTLLVLRTDWGGERVRRKVVASVNDEIQGKLEIGRLSFGGDALELRGIALRDPEGAVVAEIARVDVGFKLLRLLRKEVRVTTVAIETPLLTVVSDEDGSNLARATAPRKPKPREPPKREKPTDRHGRDGWVIRLDRFDLTGGDIRTAVAVGSDRVRKLHVAALNVFASVRYAIGNGSLDLGLRVAGRSALEPTGPLALALELAAHGDAYRVDADGKLLDGTLAAHGNVDTRHLGAADVLVALAIPRRELAGHTWGPVRIDARAQPSAAPTLDVLVKIPGVELTAKDQGREAVAVAGRLAVADLSLTGKAIASPARRSVPSAEARWGRSPAADRFRSRSRTPTFKPRAGSKCFASTPRPWKASRFRPGCTSRTSPRRCR